MKLYQAADCWYWIYTNNIRLRGNNYSLKNHVYQYDWFRDKTRVRVYKKAAQMGATETEVLRTLHGQIHGKYPQGVLYLFPSRDDVTDFSKARFQPLITDNPCIGNFVIDICAANIKKIGDSILYLRGATVSHKIEDSKESSSQLKGVPVDKVSLDEMDEMSTAMVALSIHRLDHSSVKELVKISTPTVPGFGIDLAYTDSDQKIWMIKCKKCNTETCLELEFPDCLIDTRDGQVHRVCKKCKQDIFPDDGRWVARYPERSKDVSGVWISQLNSAYIDPKTLLGTYLDPKKYGTTLAEFYNSSMGMAYVATENKLKPSDIYALCNQDAMLGACQRPTAMGIDIGAMLHVVIGYKIDETRYKIVKVERVSTFEAVHDLACRFNTKVIVVDMEPETRMARKFKEDHTDLYKVLLCDYQDRLKSHEKRDEREGLLTVRRTEVCDMTNEAVIKQIIEIPRRNPEIEEYAIEMSNIDKSLDENKATGSRTYRYHNRGRPDHYFHATNYFLLACRDFLISTAYDTFGTYQEDEKRNIYDPYEKILR